MDLQKAIRSRRTIHSFNTRKVPEIFIERAIQAANHAPCHRLTFPWRFTDVDSKKRELLIELALRIKFKERTIDKEIEKKITAKILNPSHLLVASQINGKDPEQKLEDYAASACAIQNLMLSLAGDGVGSKWSTGKITNNKDTYNVLGIEFLEEEIIGFIWVGYGETPPKVKRPLITSIYRR